MLDVSQDMGSDTCSPGKIDTSFGDNGIVSIFGLDEGVSIATGVALDAQARIVVAGGFISGARSCVLARLLPDGARDSSFGANGVVRQSLDQHACWFNKVAIQPNGDIVAIGEIDGHAEPRALVARYRSNGQLDQTFGDGGLVIFEPTLVTAGLTIAITPDEHIIAGGHVFEDPGVSFLVRKYTSAGVIDPSFGNGGDAEPPTSDARNSANRLIVQPDGKLMMAGQLGTSSSTAFSIVRYLANGSRDTTFGSEGLSTVSFGTDSQATGIALDSLGRPIVVGGATTGAAVSRLTSAGMIDTTFASAGTLLESSLSASTFASVAIQSPNDEIVAVGTWDASSSAVALVRYKADGTRDITFGTNGIASSLPLPTWRQIGWDLAIQADGRIVIVGGYGDLSHFDMLVARYCP